MHHIDAMAADAPHTIKRPLKRGLFARACMFWGGLLLVIISPLVGAIPGPGGIVVFAAGFALMLRGSHWVKKLYVRFKRRHPKKGDWVDFGLQRASYKRRAARAKGGDISPAIAAREHWTRPGELARRRRNCSRPRRRDDLLGVRPPDRPTR